MSQTLSAIGGTPPYTWTALDTLPAGLILSSAGVLSGTPTTALAGAYYTVQVTDSASNTATLELWITVLGVVAPVPPVVEVLKRSLSITPELQVIIQSPAALPVLAVVPEIEITISLVTALLVGAGVVPELEVTITNIPTISIDLAVVPEIQVAIEEQLIPVALGVVPELEVTIADAANNFVLELLFNGADGSTTFIDTSSYARSIANAGSAQISTLQSVSGGASLKLNGDPDYLQFAWDYPLEGNFTIEVDLYLTGYTTGDSTGTSEIFSLVTDVPASDLVFEVEQSLSNKVRFLLRNAGTASYCDFYSTSGLTLNTWTKVKAEVLDDTATIYFDDVANGSASIVTTRVQTASIARVGRLYAAGITARGYTGFMDNLRIIDLDL